MINYEIGKFYNFHVKSVHDTFISLKDDDGRFFTVSAFSFQSNWDYRFTPASVISCYVKDINKEGKIILMQNRLDVLNSCYKEFNNEETTFVVHKVYEYVDKPKEKRLLLEDAFGILHLYAPQTSEDKQLQEGDYIDLYVCGIAPHDNNLSNLILSHTFTQASASIPDIEEIVEQTEPAVTDEPTKIQPENQPTSQNKDLEFVYLNLGNENQHLELKKTIVYTSGSITPNIDAQMGIILKTIAGFMNADGGTLYIGVNDEGYATGIENDFKYLNTSLKDTNSYKEDVDGYENKLRCAIFRNLSTGAELLIDSLTFQEYNGHVVCKIVVNKSDDLVWVFRYELYKRLGNHTRRMADREIERVIAERLGLTKSTEIPVVKVTAEEGETSIQQPDTSTSEVEEVATEPEVIAEPIQPLREGKGSFYMNFFKDGKWSYSKDIPTDKDLYQCLPINAPASQRELLMIYADGCVNRVIPAQIKKTYQKEDHKYQNGRRSDTVDFLGLHIISDTDHVACICDYKGHTFVKVHKVKDITVHNAQNGLSLKGNSFIGSMFDGAKIIALQPITSEAAMRVTSLWKTGNQLSNSLGIQTDLPKNAYLQDEVNTLFAYCGL